MLRGWATKASAAVRAAECPCHWLCAGVGGWVGGGRVVAKGARRRRPLNKLVEWGGLGVACQPMVPREANGKC